MNTEQLSRVEANIKVALNQGRIAAMEVPQWRKAFSENYERALSQLVARPVSLSDEDSLGARYVEQTVDPFRRSGYTRSV